MRTLINLLGLLLFLVSCSNEPIENKGETIQKTIVEFNSSQLKNAGIREEMPQERVIGNTILATGTVEVPPQNKTIISVPFGGFVRSLEVLDGMTVKKGQTLLRIENPELITLQQEYLEVIANLEFLLAEKERQQLLSEKEAGTLKSYQSAKAQLEVARAKKSGLQTKLEMAGVNMALLNKGTIQRQIAIKSPFNGAVTKISVDVGAFMNPEDHLLEIIDLQHAHAEVTVFEKDLQWLKIGQEVKLQFPGQNQPVASTIFLIGKEIGKDRTINVHCHFLKESTVITPGAYFKATIQADGKKLMCVPSEAIVELNGKQVVFKGAKGENGLRRFIPVEVEVIATENDLSAIQLPGKNGSIRIPVVTSGAYSIYSSYILKQESE
jgi:cobalt-zinc-cadmium efflux system membrane fusion protein